MVANSTTSSTTSTQQGAQKAIIQVYDAAAGTDSDYLTCQFNPERLKISKQVSWEKPGQKPQPDLNAPDLVFAGGESATFSVELWFDTTTMGNQDVRGFTNKLLALTLKEEGKKSPPAMRLVWGEFKTFRAVVTQVEIEYKMFLPTGIPIRAKANVTLRQASDGDLGRLPFQNPTSRTEPRKTYRVQQGDRLDYLSYREYGNPALWRLIAEANNLDDPFDLPVGQILVIPQRS